MYFDFNPNCALIEYVYSSVPKSDSCAFRSQSILYCSDEPFTAHRRPFGAPVQKPSENIVWKRGNAGNHQVPLTTL